MKIVQVYMVDERGDGVPQWDHKFRFDDGTEVPGRFTEADLDGKMTPGRVARFEREEQFMYCYVIS